MHVCDNIYFLFQWLSRLLTLTCLQYLLSRTPLVGSWIHSRVDLKMKSFSINVLSCFSVPFLLSNHSYHIPVLVLRNIMVLLRGHNEMSVRIQVSHMQGKYSTHYTITVSQEIVLANLQKLFNILPKYMKIVKNKYNIFIYIIQQNSVFSYSTLH